MLNHFLKTTLGLLFILSLFGGTPGASEIPDEGAAFDYRRWYYKVRGEGFTLTESNKITIYNERGQDYAELGFSEDSFSKLKSVTIKVLDADGQILYERDKKDLEKRCGFDRTAIYDDACTFYGTFQAQQFPYSIAYEYVKESKTLFHLGGVVFQSRLPVHSAVYTLEADNLGNFRYRTYGLAESVEPRAGSDGRSLVWVLDSLPALDDIDFLPPGSRVPARLAVSPNQFKFDKYKMDATTWASIGRSKAQLYFDRFLPGAASLGAGAATGGPAVARMAYESVIDNVRYVAIQIGVGGWRPYAAALTLQRGFGDCKDMSTLLVSNLRLAGVESYPVFVLTRNDGPIDPDFPAINFNHVIALAVVDGDTVWMDPTCNTCPYGDLPHADEDIDVLVGFPDGGRIMRTPASDASQNVRRRDTKMHIDSTGRVSFETELQATGNYAIYLRSALPDLDDDETRRFVDRQFAGAGKKFKIESYEIRNLDSLDLPVVIRIKAALTKPARQIGATLYCSPFILNKLTSYEQAKLDEREYPLNLYYPESYSDYITLTWDSALGVDSVVVPPGDSLTYDFAEVRLRTALVSDTAHIELHKKHFAYQVDVEQFDDFLAFRKKLKKLCRGHVKFIGSAE